MVRMNQADKHSDTDLYCLGATWHVDHSAPVCLLDVLPRAHIALHVTVLVDGCDIAGRAIVPNGCGQLLHNLHEVGRLHLVPNMPPCLPTKCISLALSEFSPACATKEQQRKK